MLKGFHYNFHSSQTFLNPFLNEKKSKPSTQYWHQKHLAKFGKVKLAWTPKENLSTTDKQSCFQKKVIIAHYTKKSGTKTSSATNITRKSIENTKLFHFHAEIEVVTPKKNTSPKLSANLIKDEISSGIVIKEENFTIF